MSTGTVPTIDRLTLTKGSVISVELVELMTDKCYGTNEYNLALIGLLQAIDNHLRRQGQIVTICSIKGAIHVLTDEAAAAYNAKAGEQGVRKLARAHKRNRAVDRRNLDEFGLQAHARNVDLQGRMLSEIRRVRRKFFTEEHKRKTPGLTM